MQHCLSKNGFRACPSHAVSCTSVVFSLQKQYSLYLPGNHHQEWHPRKAGAGSTSFCNGLSGFVRMYSSSLPSWMYILRRYESEGKGEEGDWGWLYSTFYTEPSSSWLKSIWICIHFSPIAPDKQMWNKAELFGFYKAKFYNLGKKRLASLKNVKFCSR